MTVFKLKIIACIAMLIDHFGAVIMQPWLYEPYFNPDIYFLSRNIGRIAFPIFAYLIAQGCLHTKSMGKYLLRLGVLAIISEPLFDIAFGSFWDGNINFLRNTNIFYTLFLGVAAIAIYENLRHNFPKVSNFAVLAPLSMMAAAHLLSTDYSFIGVGLIFLIYLMGPENHTNRAIVLSIGIFALYFDDIIHLIFALIAIGLIALYNGKPGHNNATIKWGFYFFYPVHIAILIAIRSLL
ncbi:MAG: conjugal transfer protein TraX [Defluviitaleaceae bacterium]|nr:conjugal transfer protein TraX [Defluviitaleaceae bacterium]